MEPVFLHVHAYFHFFYPTFFFFSEKLSSQTIFSLAPSLSKDSARVNVSMSVSLLHPMIFGVCIHLRPQKDELSGETQTISPTFSS